ncbi:MAG: isoaspartyl peptidase/L-asparaginase family protein [Pseudomonadota bacterium]|nr:isoaspartyl peptidase/L-asparaginase family protein [Pseudomonadota bacterium]
MWSIILHGGAKTIKADEAEANRAGCVAALEAGRRILEAGGSSVDAVQAAVTKLENDPTFNAGYGSALNEDGEVEMCAALMEGAEFNVGAVTVIKGIRNPICAARAMLQQKPVLLAAEGARRFAAQNGVELCGPRDLIPPENSESPNRIGTHDTVGCIALDQRGRLAVGVSTGGLDGSPAGRVGDSPQPGCGYYVDDTVGAVVFSGDGEHIARMMLAARVMHDFDREDPARGVETALSHVERIGGTGGGIAMSPDGIAGWAHNTSHFAVACASTANPQGRSFLRKEEDDRES